MNQISIPLKKTDSKPILMVHEYPALLDTGADIPVTCLTDNILRSVFNAQLVISNVFFYSFGKKVYGDIYRLSIIKVGELLYPDMHIFAVSEDNLKHDDQSSAMFPLILSASMLTGLIYEIDMQNHMLNIDIPDHESVVRNLLIRRSGKNIEVLCNSVAEI